MPRMQGVVFPRIKPYLEDVLTKCSQLALQGCMYDRIRLNCSKNSSMMSMHEAVNEI